MALSFSIIFILFIVPIILGVFFLFRVKKIGIILLCIPVLITIIVTGLWIYEYNHHFVSSTNLSGESIDNIELYDVLPDTIKDTYGSYQTRDNILYESLLEFDDILIGISEAEEIIYMRTESSNMPTKEGIQVGDQINDIYEEYGENYYQNSEMGLDDSINYVDRDLRIHLQFSFKNEKIVQIVLTEM